MQTSKTRHGVEGSVFGPKLSGQLVNALDKRFPGEPLKVLGKYIKTELEVRIALSQSETEVEKWLTARREFSKILGMGFEDILNEADLKALKTYLKRRTKERMSIAKTYRSLRDLLIFRI
jgi:hypothetical protein